MTAHTPTYAGKAPYLDAHPALARALYICALSAAILIASVWIYRFASVVTDENWYDNIDGHVTIVEVAPGGASDEAGLRVGDVIVAINGHEVHDKYEANRYLVESTKGGELTYTIEREDERMDVRVVLAVLGMPVNYLAFILTGILLLSLGAFVFLRRTRYAVARLFGWTMLVLGLAMFLAHSYYPAHYPDLFTAIFQRAVSLIWIAAMSLCMHLFLHFPVRLFTRSYTWREYAWIYGLPLALSGGLALLLLTRAGEYFPMQLVLPTALSVSIVIVMVRLNRRLRDSRNPEYRERARYVKVAWVVGLALLISSGQISDDASWKAVFLLLLAVPLLLFYTIIKYRIYDLYIVIRRSSMYTTLTIGLISISVLFFLGALYVLPRSKIDVPVVHFTSNKVEVIRLQSLAPARRAEFERRVFITAGVVLLFISYVGYRRSRRWLDRRFHRGSYDYRVALREFSQLSRKYSDRQSLADSVVQDLTQLMHLKGATFAVRNGRGFRVLATKNLADKDTVFDVNREDDEQFEKLLERASSQAYDNLPIGERFASIGVEFITPIVLDHRIEAIILLGEKEAETNFTREDVDLLDNLAINVADALTTMDFYEGAKEKERMRRELEIARRIQLSALPAEIPDLPGVDIAADSLPAHEVGGDFYDFLPHHDSVTLVIGDVSGKGMPAALYLARIQGVIKTIASFKPTLWELFVRLNTQIFEHVERNTYLTMAGLQINLLNGTVRYLRAGHLPLLHYRCAAKEVDIVQSPGIGIGLDHVVFSEQLEEQDVRVEAGDVLMLITDGVTEAVNQQEEQYGLDRVNSVVRRYASCSAEEIREHLFSDIRGFSGDSDAHDDLTAIVVKFST